MKLAFCLFNYFPFGGLQRDFLRIASEWLRRGYAVDVYTMAWEGDIPPGFNVHIIKVRAWQNHTRIKQFAKALQSRLTDYDGVVGFNKMPGLDVYYAADTCYQAKARQGRSFWYRYLPRYRQLIAYERAVFQKSAETQVLLLSEQVKTDFMRYYGTASSRFHLLPPGISRDRIATSNAEDRRQKMRLAWNINEDEFLLLMIGSGFRTKGLDRIINSVAALPDALKKRTQLFVVGEDNAGPFQKLAKALNIIDKVYFLGGRKEIPEFLLAADLLLHPAYNENTGTVLLEALVAGLPVITTEVCGYARYIIEAKAGRVIAEPFDQSKLTKAITELLLSEDRAVLRDNALSYTKDADIYSLPERASDYLEMIFQKRMALA